MTLSPNGAFPDWLSLLEFSFATNHPETDKPICILRIVPNGYERNESHGVYGIYVDAFLEFEPNVCYPWRGGFLDPAQLRDLVMLISNPVAVQSDVIVRGEGMEFTFTSQTNGRVLLDGHFGTDGWGEGYLNSRFEKYPFQPNLRFKCGLTESSLRNTLDDLQKLLSVVQEIEAGKQPTFYEK